MDENRYVVSSNDMDLYYTNFGNVIKDIFILKNVFS